MRPAARVVLAVTLALAACQQTQGEGPAAEGPAAEGSAGEGSAVGGLPTEAAASAAGAARAGATGAGAALPARPADAAAAATAERVARAHRELGLALEASGDIAGAVSEFIAALDAAPWVIGPEGGIEQTPFGDLTRICLGDGPPQAVKRACTRVIPTGRIAPERLARLIVARARARLALGEVEGAGDDLDAALAIVTGDPEALLIRGRLRAVRGDLRGAEADLARVIGLHGPQVPEARLWHARVLAALGEEEQALEELDAVIADPAAAGLAGAAWRSRAVIDCRAGRAEEAAVGWQVWEQKEAGALSWIDEMLRDAGYLRGPAEETLGPRTLAALRAWTGDGCPGDAGALLAREGRGSGAAR